MNSPVNLDNLESAEQITGEDAEETARLRDMLARAESFLKSFKWCPPIVERYLAFGVGGVIALCLFKLQRRIHSTDQWLWVIEGDLPSAYFVVDEACDAAAALGVYCEMMDEWADAVEKQLPLDDVFPIGAAATKENAGMLKSRVKFLRDRILPNI